MPKGVYDHSKIRGSSYSTQDLDERFWGKVKLEDEIFPENGCMIFGDSLTDGYGKFKVKGQWFRAHRWSYERRYGPIAPGLDLDHLCRNRACVNPDHLEQVTGKINIQRGNTGANFRKGVPRPWLKNQ